MDTGSIDLEHLLAETEWLKRLVRSLVRDASSADDICQDTLLAACRRPASCSNLRAWLARVARSKVARLYVRSARQQRRERMAARPEAQPSASDELQQFHLQLALTRELDALAEPYRTAILLRLWHDLPPREVARRTGAPVETVRTRIKRGLAELRARLDSRCGSRAAWAVPLGAWSVPLPVPGPLLLLGGWMSLNTKLLFASAIVILGAIVAWPFLTAVGAPAAAPGRPAAVADVRASASAVPEQAEAAVDHAASPAVATRTEVTPVVSVPDDEPVLVAPFDLHVKVQDDGAQPVADATVELWLAHRVSRGEQGNGYQGRLCRSPAYRTARTDARGEALVKVDRQTLYVRARKEGLGASGDTMVWNTGYTDGQCLLLTLQQQVTLAGEVYAHDGSPVSAAIEFDVSGILRAGAHMPGEQRWTEAALASDRDGRFTVHLDVGYRFTVTAVQGKDRTFPVTVETGSAGEQTVRLEFPGRYGIRGFVADGRGQVAAARVLVRERFLEGKKYSAGYAGHRGEATSDGNGAFLAFVPKPGCYEILAMAPLHAASAQEEVLVEFGPTQGPTLQLLATGALAGRVVDGDGKPVAGASLTLVGVDETPPASPWSVSAAERYGHFKAVSVEDGTFTFTDLHPSALYRLECVPDPRRPMARTAPQQVRAGGGAVTVALPPGGLGRSVAGIVTDATTGQPIGKFAIRVVTSTPDGSRNLSHEHRFDDAEGRFRVEAPAGNQAKLIVRAPGFAGASIAVPEAATSAGLVVSLPRPAAFAVLVLDAQGLPAAGARVSLVAREPLADAGIRFGGVPLADAGGRFEQKQLDPGTYDVRAVSRDGAQRGEQKDVVIAPGSSGSLTVQLH